MVAKYLEGQPPETIVVVLDADVVVAVMERGLEQWARHDADLQFYERAAGKEIAAGNYMARNTVFARDFLMRWAKFSTRQPPGYSSSDNGAIHVHIIETLELEGAPRCAKLYSNLRDHMDKALKPNGSFWNFVQCTKDTLGTPRAWKASGGSLTIWPRHHFWVVDGLYSNFHASNSLGPVMHHGIKDRSVVLNTYYKSISKCELNVQKVLKEREEFGYQMLLFGRSYPDYYLPGASCKQCVERCMRTLSCPPLDDQDVPRPRRAQQT